MGKFRIGLAQVVDLDGLRGDNFEDHTFKGMTDGEILTFLKDKFSGDIHLMVKRGEVIDNITVEKV